MVKQTRLIVTLSVHCYLICTLLPYLHIVTLSARCYLICTLLPYLYIVNLSVHYLVCLLFVSHM